MDRRAKIFKENSTAQNGPSPSGRAANELRMRCSNPPPLDIPMKLRFEARVSPDSPDAVGRFLVGKFGARSVTRDRTLRSHSFTRTVDNLKLCAAPVRKHVRLIT